MIYSPLTRKAIAKYTPIACSKAFELYQSGEGASSILHGHDCGFKFTTVGQVDAAINAGRELAKGRAFTAAHGFEIETNETPDENGNTFTRV